MDDFVRQNPKEPKPSKTSGHILIAFGVIIIIVTWLIVLLTQKSKGAAEAEGVIGGLSLVDDFVQSF